MEIWDSMAVHIDVRRNFDSLTEDWTMRMCHTGELEEQL